MLFDNILNSNLELTIAVNGNWSTRQHQFLMYGAVSLCEIKSLVIQHEHLTSYTLSGVVLGAPARFKCFRARIHLIHMINLSLSLMTAYSFELGVLELGNI